MATVYSLVCFGGRTGKTVTMTIASPCVVSLTNHGLRDGTGIVFSTTGVLPTGITAGTTYYTRYVAANTFHLYDTEAHAKDTASTTGRINTSGSQSGTHTAKSKRMLDLLTQYSGRWGASGSERCYDGLASWNTGRAGASGLNEEVCELGESFVETVSASVSVTVPSGKNRITARVNGVRTSAFHYGLVNSGFVLKNTGTDITVLSVTRLGDEVEGFDLYASYSLYGLRTGLYLGRVCRGSQMIVRSEGNAYGIGVTLIGAKAEIRSSLVFNWSIGVTCDSYESKSIIDSNIFAKCGNTGVNFGSSAGLAGNSMYVRNNISLGNVTNWKTGATSLTSATNNLGLTGEAWVTSGGVRLETTETSPFSTIFVDYTNNDFRPASASSPQVDSGADYFGAMDVDIADNERPNYNNGGAEVVDVGCYEFDHGYGPHPITASLTLTGLASGTDVVVREAGTSTILDSVDSTSGSWSYTYGSAHNVDIDVIKPGMVIVTFRNLALTAESSTLPVSQQFDRNYS